ncbi:MAG TPA: UDP-N-acetylglucosamine--N-acetylmuramyl-(pentapeptide) pyrophosphoryl-undecaprenol N-acetylglucosamine transferase, partial [Alphaproteobacteria bacterium]|nr:UDP-N-acetylglucosamine--N-acetylmuramyl-(pentapeptide) pyrophosphoryl-undecaprenol N-acetylglucosamine transferase [Alphaproteobacteria bacterium]
GHTVTVLTDPRGARFDAGVSVRSVPATRLSGGIGAKLGGAFQLLQGMVSAAWHLRRDGTQLLVGFGGYPSVAPVLAAKLIGVPVVVHEQNAVLGRANARLARYARLVATSFPQVEGLGRRPQQLTGNPIRDEVAAARTVPYHPSASDEPFRLLVFGGSQGAHVFSEVVPAACALLPPCQSSRLRVTQQARPEDIGATAAAYGDLGIEAEVAPFFADLPDRMAAAHLVVARAGASTIAEVLAIGRPAVLVPYPHAMDDHQTANAQAAEDAGAAWLMPQTAFTAEALGGRLETLLNLPECAEKVAKRAHNLGRPDAASRLADVIESVLSAGEQAPQGALRSIAS